MSQNRSGSRAVSSAPTGRDAAISIGIGRYEDQQSDNMESAIGLAPNLLYESPISFQSMVESSVSRWIVDEIILDELIYVSFMHVSTTVEQFKPLNTLYAHCCSSCIGRTRLDSYILKIEV
jgi:hypothetical protein